MFYVAGDRSVTFIKPDDLRIELKAGGLNQLQEDHVIKHIMQSAKDGQVNRNYDFLDREGREGVVVHEDEVHSGYFFLSLFLTANSNNSLELYLGHEGLHKYIRRRRC